MDSRGQASAEYLLLIVVILTVMAGVTLPLIQSSVSDTMDVSKASDAKQAVQNIANAADLVYANGPGSKRTISVYMPIDGALTGGNSISTTVVTSTMTKTVSAKTAHQTQVDPSSVSKGWYTVQVTWPVGSSDIQVALTPS